MKQSLSLLALALALNAAPALAQEFKAGDIAVVKPWARATPKGAEVGGAYLTIVTSPVSSSTSTSATRQAWA
jgi:periplasmic copper chaperone A